VQVRGSECLVWLVLWFGRKKKKNEGDPSEQRRENKSIKSMSLVRMSFRMSFFVVFFVGLDRTMALCFLTSLLLRFPVTHPSKMSYLEGGERGRGRCVSLSPFPQRVWVAEKCHVTCKTTKTMKSEEVFVRKTSIRAYHLSRMPSRRASTTLT